MQTAPQSLKWGIGEVGRVIDGNDRTETHHASYTHALATEGTRAFPQRYDGDTIERCTPPAATRA